ncbi:MAG TPA: cache domain-containing protein [Burkholderiales bacterium]|nr:cache domain-containing protein [Burkholderiales bacterium]
MPDLELPTVQSPSISITEPVHASGRKEWWYFVALALPLAGIVLLGALTYRAIDRELTAAALSRNAALAGLTAVMVSEKLDRLVDIGVSLADRVRFRELIAVGRWVEASRILARVPAEFPFIDRVALFDVDGTVMGGIPDTPEVIGRSFAYRDWYRGVTRAWKPYVSEVYRRAAAPSSNVFGVAVPIRSDRQQVLGVLLLQVRLETLLDWTRSVDVGDAGVLYVVDQRANVVFHPQLPLQGDLVDFSALPSVSEALAGRKGVREEVDPRSGDARVIAYQPVPKYGWAVIADQPARAAFEARNDQLRYMLIAYALIVALFGLTAYLASRMVLERKQAADVQRTNAELERRVAERTMQLEAAMKELEGFSYSVSHDLRAPLRAINGFARMLEEDYGERLDHEGHRLLGVVRSSATQMGRLIDDLLDFSRVGRAPLTPKPVDMAALARDAAGEAAAAADGAAPAIELGPLPPARGDPALLRQVWLNLIGNAVKFSSRRDAPRIGVSGRLQDSVAIYCVADNGTGFDMRYYDKLFGVFQRLHRQEEFSGTGVGLAMVQRIVAHHGGKVWAEGRPDHGASFFFSLPAKGGSDV